MTWSPAQYAKFENERTRPVKDLLAQVPTATARRVADLGCGPGNSTEILRTHFPKAAISAIDSSTDMIEAARKRLPGIHFEVDDIASWEDGGPFDVILANASLQWVPNHESVLLHLMAKLSQGGSLAVQIPDNLDEPAHRWLREIAVDGPWANKLGAASTAREIHHSPEWYYRLLHDLGADVNVWRTIYHHPLAGTESVTEWFKGTGLRPFLDPLDATERLAFLTRYHACMARAYPPLPDGTVLLPFPRLFFVARRQKGPL